MFALNLESLYPIVQALGWALIHFLWQGAVIGALFAGGMLALRSFRPSARYIWGLICLTATAVAPVVTIVLAYELGSPASSGLTTLMLDPVMAAAPSQGMLDASWIERALPWVVLAWVGGVFALSLRVLVNWQRMRRLTRIGIKPLPTSWQDRVDALCQAYAIRRAVVVLESTIVRVPTVLGWLKPVVLLPTSSMVGLTPEQLELVIAHELGHIHRLDYLVNLFQVLVETVLFYHPVVAWISRRIRDEREKCCDDLVIRTCGDRLQYAKALANLETMRSGALNPALAATDGQLLQRIERIVCHHHTQPRDGISGHSLLILILAAAVVVAGQLADPFDRLEGRRAELSDRLMSGWLSETINGQAEQPFAALEDARLDWVASSAPVVEEIRSQARPEPKARVAAPAPEVKELPVVNQAPIVEQISVPEKSTPAMVPSVAEPIDPLFDQLTRGDSAVTPAQVASAPVQTLAPTVSKPDQPVPSKRVAPTYPVRARLNGQEGYVLVEFSIRNNGKVSKVKVIESEPRRVFEKAARRAILAWRFDPATLHGFEGKRFNQRFDFNLKPAQPPVAQSADKRSCVPMTGTRVCRSEAPAVLKSQQKAGD
jgi:TonB family protein